MLREIIPHSALATAATGKRKAMQRIAAAPLKASAARIVPRTRQRRTLRAAWVIAQRKVARVQRPRTPARRVIVRPGQAMAAPEAAPALRRQAPAGAPTIIAASRSSLLTRRARILRRAGVIQPHLALTLLRQAAVTAAEAALAPRAVMGEEVIAPLVVMVEEVALRGVMEAEAVRAAMVVEAPAEALTPVEAEATPAVEEAVTPVAAEGAPTAVVAAIRIANLCF